MSLGSRVRVGAGFVPFPCQKGGVGVEMQVLVRISPILLFSDRLRIKPYPLKQKKGGEFAPKGQCVDLFAGQKWCISGNPGNTLSGHHLSVGNPSVCSPGIPCQVLWSGMLGLGRDRQRQLRFSKAMDSNFTACPHHSGMQTAFLVHKLQKLLFGVLSDALASLHPSRDI